MSWEDHAVNELKKLDDDPSEWSAGAYWPSIVCTGIKAIVYALISIAAAIKSK